MSEVLGRISGLSQTISKSKSSDRFPNGYHCKTDVFFLQLVDSLAIQAKGEHKRKGMKNNICQAKNYLSYSLSSNISPSPLF